MISHIDLALPPSIESQLRAARRAAERPTARAQALGSISGVEQGAAKRPGPPVAIATASAEAAARPPRAIFSRPAGKTVHPAGLSSAACGARSELLAVLDSRLTKSTKTVAPIAARRLASRTFQTRLAAPPGATRYAATSATRPIAAVAKVPMPPRRNLSTTSAVSPAVSPTVQPRKAIHEGVPARIVANTRPVTCSMEASTASISADLYTVAERVRQATSTRTRAPA